MEFISYLEVYVEFVVKNDIGEMEIVEIRMICEQLNVIIDFVLN